MDLLVLVEQRVWDDFEPAVRRLGTSWTAPSGRAYRLTLEGRRLEVHLVGAGSRPTPSGDEIDADLFALAGELYDAVGGEWSAGALRTTAEAWGYAP